MSDKNVKCPRCVAHGRFSVHGIDPRKIVHYGDHSAKGTCFLCDGEYEVPAVLAAAYTLRFDVDPNMFQVGALKRELGCG